MGRGDPDTRDRSLTCRKRHKKCDEQKPVCRPCSISQRPCVYSQTFGRGAHPHTEPRSACGASVTSSQSTTSDDTCARITAAHETDQAANVQPGSVVARSLDGFERQRSQCGDSGILVTDESKRHDRGAVPKNTGNHNEIIGMTGTHVSRGHDCSPDDSTSSETWPANFASIRWLDLLASDAAQADSSFPLELSSSPANRCRQPPQRGDISVHVSPALMNGQAHLPDDLDPELERAAWQSSEDVSLSGHEAVLLRHFAERCASWLDVLDPYTQFSVYAIRLAMRNMGLMKAILALAAKHWFTSSASSNLATRGAAQQAEKIGSGNFNGTVYCENSEWIRYYYETLQYVHEKLRYSSYSHSEELLATALIISAYEMLDESDGSGNWQRHLKGIFWIQRSQDVDGECGGLRQAVWWAWLRQDVWAAFRESRACLTIWVPRQTPQNIDQDHLAERSVYLLAQAINYRASAMAIASCSSGDAGQTNLKKQGLELHSMAEEWKASLGEKYNALPTPGGITDEAFAPIWIHPPRFGAALQIYYFAKILITLHGASYGTPSSSFSSYLKMQRTITEAVDSICGIAMELRQESCQIISAQCLYGAGLCITASKKRDQVISLMEECEKRVHWAPMATWRADLRREWTMADDAEKT